MSAQKRRLNKTNPNASHFQEVAGKTENQRKYISAIASNDVIFCSGPAGTGKTTVAVGVAVGMLMRNEVKKIVLTRPTIEACGEHLGFMPGDIEGKLGPYMTPLYDAFGKFLSIETLVGFKKKEIIEIAPLAFMRGRTLEDAVIIVDEAQNANDAQIKMMLTRIGMGSKLIINGDASQSDLNTYTDTALNYYIHYLTVETEIERVQHVLFDKTDIVRHPIIDKILSALPERK